MLDKLQKEVDDAERNFKRITTIPHEEVSWKYKNNNNYNNNNNNNNRNNNINNKDSARRKSLQLKENPEQENISTHRSVCTK